MDKHFKNSPKKSEDNSQSDLQRIKLKRPNTPDAETLFKSICQGNIATLAQAITCIESQKQSDRIIADQLISKCIHHTSNTSTIRIGITGVPGVGKSTFIEALGNFLVTKNKTIAVLTIDPSSSISKGSILGDKTRMTTLATHPNVFIRPSPSRASLGGVAQYTQEAIALCEAAGFSIVLVETVGIGQSEIEVSQMVDFVWLLKLASAGDELQGLKRGIIEIADGILINKADGNNLKAAKVAQSVFTNALHMYPKKPSGWSPKVFVCSAQQNMGVKESWDEVNCYLKQTQSNGFFEEKRSQQSLYWLKKTIENQLKSNFFEHPEIKKKMEQQIKSVKNHTISPFQAAESLLKLYKSKG